MFWFGRVFLDNDKRLLPLPLIPFQGSRDGMEPVGGLIIGADRWERILRRSNLDVITLYKGY